MTGDIDNLIKRGGTLTGSKLLEAIKAATGKVVGGRGIRVNTINRDTVVSLRGHPIIGGGGGLIFFTVITNSVPLGGTNRWVYNWAEAIVDTIGSSWEPLPGGRTGSARNTAEHLNTPSMAFGGVDLDALPGDVEVLPVQDGQAVPMAKVTDIDGDIKYWFHMMNGAQVACPAIPPDAVPLPPPPVLAASGLLA